jgi:hypothetical protein
MRSPKLQEQKQADNTYNEYFQKVATAADASPP